MSIGVGLDVFGQVLGINGLSPGTVTKDDLVPILEDIQYRFSVIGDVFSAANSASNSAVNAATDAAGQAEKIGQNVKDITHHILDTIIPHSMAWLAGYIVQKFIAPIWRRLDQDETRIGILEGFRRSTDTWRYNYVDPNIKDWRAFHEWFLGWPQGILFRWRDYFAHPDHFATWATPPLVGPIVSYLAQREHHGTRDNLTRIMAQAWSEVANDIWHDIERWLLSET